MEDMEIQAAEILNPKKEYTEVLCLRDYKGFKKGCIYAQVGWNNGTQVVRETKNGDVVCLLCWDSGDMLVPLSEVNPEKHVFRYVENEE